MPAAVPAIASPSITLTGLSHLDVLAAPHPARRPGAFDQDQNGAAWPSMIGPRTVQLAQTACRFHSAPALRQQMLDRADP